jgi:hypothetical protein
VIGSHRNRCYKLWHVEHDRSLGRHSRFMCGIAFVSAAPEKKPIHQAFGRNSKPAEDGRRR